MALKRWWPRSERVVAGSQIAEAPLDGRNVMDLATLLPGVVPVPDGGGNGAFNMAGARGDSVTYMLDGGMNNDLLSNGLVYNPNPDAVEEFRVLTSNYSAEFGRNGGGIVSVVTKSGTNDFHGALFDYIRNNDFNANTFFNNEQAIAQERPETEPVRRGGRGAGAGFRNFSTARTGCSSWWPGRASGWRS